MILLVTGGRQFCESHDIAGNALDKHRDRIMDERRALGLALDALNPTTVVTGGQRGADAWAAIWARKRGVDLIEEPADWKAHGPSAGPIRNQAMITKYRPDYGVAFPGAAGTANCVSLMRRAGIDVYEISIKFKQASLSSHHRQE